MNKNKKSIMHLTQTLNNICLRFIFEVFNILHNQLLPNNQNINKLYQRFLKKNGIIFISLIGNCQVVHLSKIIAQKNKKIKVIQVIQAHKFVKKDGNLYKELDKSDYIVTQNISESFDYINTKNIENRYKGKVVKILNLYYKGYHQDWTYMPIFRGVRLKSPTTGDYHNQTIIQGFIDGLSTEEVLLNVNSKKYNKEMYSLVAEKSYNELKKRENDVDIKITKDLRKEIEGSIECFHTFNHPKKRLLNIEANKLLEYLKIENKKFGFTGECLGGIILRTNPICTIITKNETIKKKVGVINMRNYIEESFDIYRKNIEHIEFYKKNSTIRASTSSDM